MDLSHNPLLNLPDPSNTMPVGDGMTAGNAAAGDHPSAADDVSIQSGAAAGNSVAQEKCVAAQGMGMGDGMPVLAVSEAEARQGVPPHPVSEMEGYAADSQAECEEEDEGVGDGFVADSQFVYEREGEGEADGEEEEDREDVEKAWAEFSLRACAGALNRSGSEGTSQKGRETASGGNRTQPPTNQHGAEYVIGQVGERERGHDGMTAGDAPAAASTDCHEDDGRRMEVGDGETRHRLVSELMSAMAGVGDGQEVQWRVEGCGLTSDEERRVRAGRRSVRSDGSDSSSIEKGQLPAWLRHCELCR